MTDFRAASPGARDAWDEATKCKACECEEDIFHIPIESKTSCIITPESDKRMAYAHSKKTPSCSKDPPVSSLRSFFMKSDNKIAFTMRVEMEVRKFLITNYVIFPYD